MSRVLDKIPVADPFGAAADPFLPTVEMALDPGEVKAAFKRGLPRLAGPTGQVIVKSIRVIRHKPGKRAVIEYDVRLEQDGRRQGKALLIGKIRAKRSGNEAYRLLDQLWQGGFQRHSADGISVPEPIAVLPSLRMWLQRKIPGQVVWPTLTGPAGVPVARRIADAIHKLHAAGIATQRQHSMADELRILHQCLGRMRAARPPLARRLEQLLAACARLGAALPAAGNCGIHRDFYPAQVILYRSQLALIDFDLYCQGDPGLDVGNFIAHITEESLRTLGHAAALQDREEAMVARYVELAGESVRPSIQVYTTLSLARHVYLTTQFPERTPFTEPLLQLCEQRLAEV